MNYSKLDLRVGSTVYSINGTITWISKESYLPSQAPQDIINAKITHSELDKFANALQAKGLIRNWCVNKVMRQIVTSFSNYTTKKENSVRYEHREYCAVLNECCSYTLYSDSGFAQQNWRDLTVTNGTIVIRSSSNAFTTEANIKNEEVVFTLSRPFPPQQKKINEPNLDRKSVV